MGKKGSPEPVPREGLSRSSSRLVPHLSENASSLHYVYQLRLLFMAFKTFIYRAAFFPLFGSHFVVSSSEPSSSASQWREREHFEALETRDLISIIRAISLSVNPCARVSVLRNSQSKCQQRLFRGDTRKNFTRRWRHNQAIMTRSRLRLKSKLLPATSNWRVMTGRNVERESCDCREYETWTVTSHYLMPHSFSAPIEIQVAVE